MRERHERPSLHAVAGGPIRRNTGLGWTIWTGYRPTCRQRIVEERIKWFVDALLPEALIDIMEVLCTLNVQMSNIPFGARR
jgi:hypothetical protein